MPGIGLGGRGDRGGTTSQWSKNGSRTTEIKKESEITMEQSNHKQEEDLDPMEPQVVPIEALIQTAISQIGEKMQPDLPNDDEKRDRLSEALTWAERVLKIKRYSPVHESLCLALHIMAGDWYQRKNPRCLIISGDTGCGKTHSTNNFYKYCRATAIKALYGGGWTLRTPSPHWVHWPDAMASYADGAVWSDLFPSLADPVMLFLDDVGQEADKYKSGDMNRALLSVLSARQHKYTILTTNVHPDRFVEVYGRAVEDRLYRSNGMLVDLWGAPSFTEL